MHVYVWLRFEVRSCEPISVPEEFKVHTFPGLISEAFSGWCLTFLLTFILKINTHCYEAFFWPKNICKIFLKIFKLKKKIQSVCVLGGRKHFEKSSWCIWLHTECWLELRDKLYHRPHRNKDWLVCLLTLQSVQQPALCLSAVAH